MGVGPVPGPDGSDTDRRESTPPSLVNGQAANARESWLVSWSLIDPRPVGRPSEPACDPGVRGRHPHDRGHRRAAQDVQPQVDLHPEVAKPDLESALPDDERDDGRPRPVRRQSRPIPVTALERCSIARAAMRSALRDRSREKRNPARGPSLAAVAEHGDAVVRGLRRGRSAVSREAIRGRRVKPSAGGRAWGAAGTARRPRSSGRPCRQDTGHARGTRTATTHSPPCDR